MIVNHNFDIGDFFLVSVDIEAKTAVVKPVTLDRGNPLDEVL